MNKSKGMSTMEAYKFCMQASGALPFVVAAEEGVIEVSKITKHEGKTVVVPTHPLTCTRPTERVYSLDEILRAMSDLIAVSEIKRRLPE